MTDVRLTRITIEQDAIRRRPRLVSTLRFARHLAHSLPFVDSAVRFGPIPSCQTVEIHYIYQRI